MDNIEVDRNIVFVYINFYAIHLDGYMLFYRLDQVSTRYTLIDFELKDRGWR